jgi:hypothetical protein
MSSKGETVSHEIAFTHNKDSVELLQKRKEFIEGFIQHLYGIKKMGKDR